MTASLVALGLVIGLVFAAGALRTWEGQRATRMLERWRNQEAPTLATASLRHSRTVVRGQITEQVTPLLPGFPWIPTDARFLGKPVDYIVFDGYDEVRAGLRDRLREVVFLDIKTGRSGLSKAERRVKACVEAGAVSVMVLPGTGQRSVRQVDR